jgi:hypothetical protein
MDCKTMYLHGMKVHGFSFIRNGVIYDYPFQEAILSIAPLCDKIFVAVGNSDDNTYDLVKNLNPKIEIIETIWDDSLREGGRVLAVETDKALSLASKDCDWCIYIQGDECFHEKDYPAILEAMQKYKNDQDVEGLLFSYTHFYGSYDYIGGSPGWYRQEIRIVKPNSNLYSYKDAQGFRIKTQECRRMENGVMPTGRKLKVIKINAKVYHYGWVKHPEAQQRKQENFNKLWHSDQWIKKNVIEQGSFDYRNVDFLKKFEGTHPKVMHERINNQNWKLDFDPSINRMNLKKRWKLWMENTFGFIPFEYRNFKIIKK